ncbi:SemiSWEET transporter [Hydrogenophaga electricum]|uniref:Sugar transporter SemiSWEET n=1 Tax=Hydrogenophaga electricum TaxID=1230953 RepID=A0ABQ6C3D6_9BURK|nr:SemiSWEET transporter [Hydrogenophaga electricum]GLS14746.1 sugar transporter SemiSWEET [Hydrogenophaga electricum]
MASLSTTEDAMTPLELFGLAATFMTTSSFVPQVWRTWKTRDVSGISLPTFLILTIGLAMWLAYGILIGDLPLTVANAVMVVLTGAIVIMKLTFRDRAH